MRQSLLVLVSLAMLGVSSPARADDAAACSDAFEQSQVKRAAGKLIEARTLFRVCQAPSCSPTQQKLCSEWLTDVEVRMPSIVLAAKDGSGADLADVKVTMDGAPIATKLDGRTVDVDPGPHSFVFELPDGTRAETKAVADERGKGRMVSVTLSRAIVPVAPPPPVVAPASGAAALSPATPTAEDPSSGGSSLRTIGLVTGAAGVAGIVLGAAFGVEALSTKSSHCSNGLCDPGSSGTVYSQATISTVGFVAGGVLLASGVALFLAAPKGGSEPASASVSVAPIVGHSAGGLSLGGSW